MSNHSVQTVSTSNDKYKVILAVAALVSGIAAFYILAGQSTWVRAAALVVGLAVAVALVAVSEMGRNFVEFAKEAVRETKKSCLAYTQRSWSNHSRCIRFCVDHGDFSLGN